ncbi:methyltransferase domain-containing protein [Synechococcus sp. CBW1002]|uniref:class I SAM-dependent methyltransferase n=1 Tax=Synechococcus sp. CBW1002 TaxID=1353134 RepID=UPI0018CD84B6|nr:methyltransferase domain-containing protein [Synechococcus sp. CBW1002]QPN59113.1 methyltransferase domain-containing protein [Synechococcus sp. CBW1002]
MSLAQVLEQAEQILGIDPSRLHEGDSLHLPLSDESFEWVVETGVLHHIRDRKRAVAEMARVARHGMLISDTHTVVGSTARCAS